MKSKQELKPGNIFKKWNKKPEFNDMKAQDCLTKDKNSEQTNAMDNTVD